VLPHRQHARLDLDRARVEPREVEQLVEQPHELRGVVVEELDEGRAGVAGELVRPCVKGRRDAVDHGRGRAQLVRGERHVPLERTRARAQLRQLASFPHGVAAFRASLA